MDANLGPDTCKLYSGGTRPIAYCAVGGGHGGPLNTIADAAWAFWNAP